MRVVFVGAGNLATRLSLEMRKSGMSIGQVYSHTSEHAKILSIPLVIVKNTGMVPNGLVNVKKEVKHSNANGNNVSIDVLFLGYGQK